MKFLALIVLIILVVLASWFFLLKNRVDNSRIETPVKNFYPTNPEIMPLIYPAEGKG